MGINILNWNALQRHVGLGGSTSSRRRFSGIKNRYDRVAFRMALIIVYVQNWIPETKVADANTMKYLSESAKSPAPPTETE